MTSRMSRHLEASGPPHFRLATSPTTCRKAQARRHIEVVPPYLHLDARQAQTSLVYLGQDFQVTRTSDESGLAIVVIKRRNILQDAARSYAVFIDGAVVGKMWAFQTKIFPLVPGPHELQLKIVNTGRSCSDVFKIDVKARDRVVFRTHFRGMKNALMLPFALPAGASALARDKQLQSKYYEWPWIRMKLEQ